MTTLTQLRQHADRQQFDRLLADARQYLRASNDNRVLPLLALAHAHLGDSSETMRYLTQAEGLVHQLDDGARTDLAGVYCVMGRVDDAAALLAGVLENQPDDALALARMGWCRMHQGQTAKAHELYLRSAQLEPHRLPVWMALARLSLAENDVAAAQSALERAIQVLEECSSDLPEPVREGLVAQVRGLQLEIWVAGDAQAQAVQWLEERRDDLDEETWCGLSKTYCSLLAERGMYAEAEDALQTARKHYRDNLTLLSLQAELSQVQGRTMQAVQLLRRCIRLVDALGEEGAADAVRYRVRLSGVCLHQQEKQSRRFAEQAMERAQALEAGESLPEPVVRQLRLQAKNALAQVESQAQNYDRARELFEEVLSEAPNFVPALQGLGHQLMQLGDIEKAVALFERMCAVDPVKGHAALINARRIPSDTATLEKIEQAARQPSLEGPVRATLMLQLASAWEKQGNYDRAFALAREGNEATKGILSYDPHAHRNRCARIRHAFTSALYEHRKECGLDTMLPVFVVGMPRSGTTLVEQILASHSRIFGAGELGIIPARIAGLNRWERQVGSGRRYPDCVDDISPAESRGIAQGIIDELKELAAADKPDALHVVDKLPHNFENIGLIKFLFPRARIISVRRDPRDIAISNYFTDYQAKHGGMGFAYDLTWIGEQLADHNLLMHHWNEVFPGEILEVQYEELLEDPEHHARRMLEYIGVEWEPQVLAFNKLERPVKTASVWQVRQPLYKTSKARWKRFGKYLAPLIEGTNAPIEPDPVTDMITLPEPGWFTEGVDLFHAGDLDGAELRFKKMLHHNPDHAGCQYMLGLVYACKGYVADAVPLFEAALKTCPWQKEWRENLIRAYEETGAKDKAEQLRRKGPNRRNKSIREDEPDFEQDASLTESAQVYAQPEPIE